MADCTVEGDAAIPQEPVQLPEMESQGEQQQHRQEQEQQQQQPQQQAVAEQMDKCRKASQAEPQDRAARWQRALLSRSGQEDRHDQPFSSWTVQLNEPNQRVIRADCERTRADMEYFRRPDIRDKMEAMLTYWCQQQRSRYKQGLNEVIAPFLFLQADEAGGTPPSDDQVFACFSAFLRRYVPFFDSQDFVPLQCAFVFFRRLLIYHRPDLHNLLVDRGVSPDMFCMPWFLTIFASKTPLKLTLQLWDRHLERSEPPFFVFLAAAVLASSEQAIFAADRSQLPEILTHLGMSSREELEHLWSAADSIYNRTPATFAARLRRNVLRMGVNKGGQKQRNEGMAQDDQEAQQTQLAAEANGGALLERLEQERCFFILPEEVVGHCYPPRSGEPRRPWHPSAACPWRLLVLDLRPLSDFESMRLPCALHFDPFGSSAAAGTAQASGQHGAWVAAGRKLMQWGRVLDAATAADPTIVFEALKATLGEDWVCDRGAHICLLGVAEDAAWIRSLYHVLTQQLTYRHVSVASGGFEAVLACAEKQGLEIVRSDDIQDGFHELDTEFFSQDKWGSKFASAWSKVRKVAAASTGKVGESGSGAEQTEAQAYVKTADSQAAQETTAEGSGVAPVPPTRQDRPGNWSADVDLACLPRRPWEEVRVPGLHWSCTAAVVRRSEPAASGANSSWAGCLAILSIVGVRLVCVDAGGEDEATAAVLAEFEIARVLKVTAKKHAADVLIFYFHDGTPTPAERDAGGGQRPQQQPPEPSMVLHFQNGTADVETFILALRDSYAASQEPAPQLAAQKSPGSTTTIREKVSARTPNETEKP